MADISKITLPNGASYNFKDATARSGLAGKAEASHTHSSYVNQNAFSNITVGSTTVSADSVTDTLTLVAGSNITITPDATNDKITIASTNTWRGIQNNLASDSTTDSLSAAQGKVLKGLVDGKASSSHTHSVYALKAKYGDTTINVGRKTDTTAGAYSTAEGYNTTASGNSSHAEGNYTTASGVDSHAEGFSTTASGNYSHAEGYSTTVSGDYSHAEGYNTIASGVNSHAEGTSTTASGNRSHAAGLYTKALHDNEVAYGSYNESNDNTLFSVGDGTSDTARHNAFEITTTGGKLHDKEISTTQINVRDMTLLFKEITWTKSGAGKYYTTISVPNVTKIISVCLTNPWGEFLDSDIVQPIANDTSVELICNTNKNNGTISLRITYI